MTTDPLFITYLQVAGLGFVAALLVVILCALLFRGAGAGAGGLTAARDWLIGRKTYLLAGLLMALGAAKQQGWLDPATYDEWTEFILGGAIITYKAALGRVEARLGQIGQAPTPSPPPAGHSGVTS